ncbi:hypothetical protein V7079_27245 [Priestia megaterium]|uniref:hypothetical protein n=1 Tax=Priestia megaterium TaxID=1404 RepID=UPI000BF2EA28|nr:hypothetical protein [Priestia megaterium]PFK01959.1 hypothetical protein COI96_06080 [Priestia megaterium]PMD08174.1 hypothetical protein CJ194_19450 [Priestia megaterium]
MKSRLDEIIKSNIETTELINEVYKRAYERESKDGKIKMLLAELKQANEENERLASELKELRERLLHT